MLRDSADEPSERVGSLVVNPGGPGAPGTSYAEQASQVFRSALTDHFDVVGFDPRGTGESAPVDCLSDGQMDAFLQADPVPDDEEEIGEVVEGLDDFWAGCVTNTDGGAAGIVSHVTTIEAARDMDVLRAALGEAQLMYFGASYGTKLGATYADLFPDKVGRLVLDGAVDVSLDSVSLSLGQAAGFERALTAYVDDCIDEGDCFLGDTTEEGLDTIAEILADLDENPLPTLDERELTVGTGFLGVITPLYNRDYWYLLDQGLEMALDGDGTTLQLLADAYASRNPDGSYADNSTEAIYAINCLDDPFAITADEVPDYIPRVPGGLADPRRGVRLGADRLRRHRGGVLRAGPRHQGRRRGADRRGRYDARPGDPLRVGGRAGRPARVRRPGQPRRRRAHRLQLRQRVRGRGPRGLPGRGDRPGGRAGVLTARNG